MLVTPDLLGMLPWFSLKHVKPRLNAAEQMRAVVQDWKKRGANIPHENTAPQIHRCWMKHLTHVDARGEARMVDVSAKPVMLRHAVATGEIRLRKPTLKLVRRQGVAKGNVLAAARLAGILAAKKTGDLIPLCHPLPITHCEVTFAFPKTGDRIVITASATVAAQTGVEMEALTAVSVAALTIYDMCKAVDKTMCINDIRLISKSKS